MKARSTFGTRKSFRSPTPVWAKWMFRITFLLTASAMLVIGGDPSISDFEKVRINNYLQGFSMLVFGVSKMFGVKVKEDGA